MLQERKTMGYWKKLYIHNWANKEDMHILFQWSQVIVDSVLRTLTAIFGKI